MKTKLIELKNVRAQNCVTIILNTHRTLPDNEKDAIQLKNLIKEAESELLAVCQQQTAEKLTAKIHELASTINHRHNLESMILFVNENTAEIVRLTIPVEDRVVVGNRFAMRDLIRGLHNQTNYYVLVLNKDEARLIEASNDKVVKECGFPFPFQNELSQTSYMAEPSDAGKIRNLTTEFFNQVDKVVNKVHKDHPLPILISADEQHYHDYIRIADKPTALFPEFLSRSRQAETDHAIVSDAWEIVRKLTQKQNDDRKADLQAAVSTNNFISDTTEIYQAIKQGRVQTLFVEEHLFQPAIIDNETIVYVSGDTVQPDAIDDIYDELIGMNMDFGGDVVFLPKESLAKFNGFAAMTRY